MLQCQNRSSWRGAWQWLWLLVGFSLSWQVTSATLDAETLVIGAISSNPQKHILRTQPLANYLADHLGDAGISQARVVVTETVEEMGARLQAGEVDLVSETVFSAQVLEQDYGAELLLRRWKKGVSQYHSLIFVRADRGFKSLADLKGRVIVFEDRGSTSSYYIPASMLLQAGFELQALPAPDASVPADKIGFVFADDILPASNEVSISSWVYRGVVAAGALSNINWQDEGDMPLRFRGELQVLAESLPFPRSLMLARPGLDPALKARIKALLLSADESEAGRLALRAYQNTRQFDALDNQAHKALMMTARRRALIDHSVDTVGE